MAEDYALGILCPEYAHGELFFSAESMYRPGFRAFGTLRAPPGPPDAPGRFLMGPGDLWWYGAVRGGPLGRHSFATEAEALHITC